MVSRRQQLGADGEARVADHYEARGYTVLERNWRCRDGELDLVLRSGRTLVDLRGQDPQLRRLRDAG